MANAEETFDVLDVTQTSSNSETALTRFISKLPAIPNRPTAHFAVGTTSGWVVGYTSKKIGRLTATAIGGGFLIIQIAHQTGYLSIDWNKLDRDMRRARRTIESNEPLNQNRLQSFAEKATGIAENIGVSISLPGFSFQFGKNKSYIDKVQQVVKENAVLSASFLGGFLLGLAS